MKSPANPPPRSDSLLRVLPVVLAALVLSLLSPRTAARAPARPELASSHAASTSTPGSPAAKWGHLPMRFEQNAGQVDDQVRFVARGGGTTLFLTDEGATLTLRTPRSPGADHEPVASRRLPHELARPSAAVPSLPDTVLRMTVAGGRRVAPRAEEKLVTISNYFIGNEPAKWHTDIPNFGRVVYPGVLDGVDLVYHGEEGQLEYDFVVAPGADSGAIALDVSGAQELSLTDVGDLAIRTEHGVLVQPRPRVYQRGKSGETEEVVAAYRLIGERGVGFVVAAYDRERELVIDPVLEYSTYLGGSSGSHMGSPDNIEAIAVDAAGCAYVAGATTSPDFPTQTPFQASATGVSAFVSKLSAAGDALVYSTYIGGQSWSYYSWARAIVIDALGQAILTGGTSAPDFPTQNPFQSTLGGASGAAFVVKLTPSGSGLAYSTYLGGAGGAQGQGIAVDRFGSAYVTGYARGEFPVQDALQASSGGGNDAFVAKLTPAGSALTYSTFLGGTGEEVGRGIALDAAGSAYVTGTTTSVDFPTRAPFQAVFGGGYYDVFVTKLSPTGAGLVYSTFLGGSGYETSGGIAVDSAGSAYVSGGTSSSDFPTRGAFQSGLAGSDDAFVSKLSPTGASLVYSTYLGGGGYDSAFGIALDAAGRAYVVGNAAVAFPLKYPFQAASPGSSPFITKLSEQGDALIYSTFLCGTSTYGDGAAAIAVDSAGAAYVAGETGSTDFPTKNPFQGSLAGGSFDGFIAKLVVPAPTLTPPTATVLSGGRLAFTATAGTGPTYTFTLKTNASGATLGSTTGAYLAGPTGNVTDVVLVTDYQGGTATATVTVTAAVADAGPDAAEAGAADAGPALDAASPSPTPAPPGDASASAPAGASFEGGGCRTSGAPAPGGGAVGLGLLALVSLAARRRTTRSSL